MIQLPEITLIAVATQDQQQTLKALEYSCKGISFGVVKFVSDYNPRLSDSSIHWDRIDPFNSIDDWNYYITYWLGSHVDTPYCLLVHADGFVVNPQSWQDKWLDYAYIGSPWDMATSIAIQGGRDQPLSRVGNSVSIRSKKLLDLPRQINLPWKRFNNDSNEDTFISCHNRIIFEENGCKFAPLEIAVGFGREQEMPENAHITEPFVFHKWYGRNSTYPRF